MIYIPDLALLYINNLVYKDKNRPILNTTRF